MAGLWKIAFYLIFNNCINLRQDLFHGSFRQKMLLQYDELTIKNLTIFNS